MIDMRLRYFSTFSGIGGFELGIQDAYEYICCRPAGSNKEKINIGYDSSNTSGKYAWEPPSCIGFSEIDKYAIQIYQKHFSEHKNYGDITKINEDKLPDFDFFVGGFPCQSFSIAGKRGGFNDTRGTLFFDIARILDAKKPSLLLLENVKGLLSHDKGKTFSTIINSLDELGYDLQWQVLNSKNFGVPQNRERVFIVGHFRGTSRPKVFPIIESVKKDIVQLNQPKHSNNKLYSKDGLSPTLNTMQDGRRQPKIQVRITKDGFHQFRNDKKKSSIQGTHVTFQKGKVHCMNTNHIPMLYGTKIRRLTPLECERLQGFPDRWTEGISDTQRYKCLGNAVTVNVVKAIVTKLFES